MPSQVDGVLISHLDRVLKPEQLNYGNITTRFKLKVLIDAFVPLKRDAETNDFLLRSKRRGLAENRELSKKCAVLREGGMSLTDANATLGRAAMHVISTKQAGKLLEQCGEGLGKKWLLDVGAGNGEVTEKLSKSFEKTCVTESSSGMAKRLRERGFDVVLESDSIETVVADVRELGEDLDKEGFDVITALNLCDRVSAPITLMSQLKRALKQKTGVLILAIVVPFRPFVEGANRIRIDPTEVVPGVPSTGTWEAGVEALWENLISPAGFDLVALSRVPYICEGDQYYGAYILDDAIFVLRPKP